MVCVCVGVVCLPFFNYKFLKNTISCLFYDVIFISVNYYNFYSLGSAQEIPVKTWNHIILYSLYPYNEKE